MNHKPVLSEVEWIETTKSTIGNRKSQISSLINPFTHALIHTIIQNKPNFLPPTLNSTWFTGYQPPTYYIRNTRYENMKNKPNFTPQNVEADRRRTQRVTGHGSRIIKNEPNFTTNAPTNQANDADFTHNFSSEISKKAQNFPKISKIIKKNAFCKLLKIIHLTPCTTKTYINIHTKIHLRFTRKDSRKKRKKNAISLRNLLRRARTHLLIHPSTHQLIYVKQTQFYTHPRQTSYAEPKAKSRRAGAKRTQFQKVYVPKGTKTNPITIPKVN